MADLDRDALVALSVRLEAETMADSIPTIERIYCRTDDDQYRRDGGEYECAFSAHATWPGSGFSCPYTSPDPVEMWRHVHFTPHPPASPAFGGRTLEQLLAEEATTRG